MNVPILAFFGNRNGVGTTSLVYHLASMYADLGVNVIAADFDPQATLTGMFLQDDRLEKLWGDERGSRNTVYAALRPLLDGTGDIAALHVEEIEPGIGLLAGDPALSSAEDEFSNRWRECLDRKPRAFRLLSALGRILRLAAEENAASLALIDAGPLSGAFNRAALVTADHVVVPIAPDVHSLPGLRSLGWTLNRWRSEWRERRDCNPIRDLDISNGSMRPIGYALLRHAIRLDRPVMEYARWLDLIPKVYREAVVGEAPDGDVRIEDDPYCLATLHAFRMLTPLTREARKPMFRLKPADGAIGGHAPLVQDSWRAFRELARTVAARADIAVP